MRLKPTVLTILVLGWGALAAVFFWINSAIEAQRIEGLQKELHDQAEILSSVFDSHSPEVDRLADEIARHAPYRITVIAEDGKVVGDSDFSGERLARLENHANRTEITEAKRAGSGDRTRYSTSLETWLMYSATRLRHSDGFVRLAMPIPERRLLAPPLRLPLAALLLFAGGAAAFMTRRIRKTISEPRSKLEHGIEQIAEGRPAYALGIHSAEELGSTARSLETLAGKAEVRMHLLESEKNYLKAVLVSMSEGVLIADTRGRVTRVNPAFVEIFRLDRDPVGRTALEIVRNPSIEAGLSEVLRSGHTCEHEEEIKVEDRVLLARFARLERASEVLGVVVVFHDITRLRRLENVRKEFVSNLSHEFRTPLTSIRGYAETVVEERCDCAVHRDFLPKIHRNALQLSQMIDELFKLASLENGSDRLERRMVNFHALVAELEKEFSPRLAEKGVQLLSEAEPGAEVFLAHEAYLLRILHNLLDNALKYTDAGQIKVSVNKAGDEIVLAVADTGVGIPAEDLERIFERFYRVNKDRSRQTGGSGIGLALVKHLVQVHGGRVWAESKLGQGATFFFSLPAVSKIEKLG